MTKSLWFASLALLAVTVTADTCNQQDKDRDGYNYDVDCDDNDNLTYPGAPEQCDGRDNNCDNTVPANELDGDKDGYRGCSGDCDDTSASVNPASTEICDGKDNNCDGVLSASEQDADQDGYAGCLGDCDDTNPAVFPAAEEVCDGQDNNCDNIVPANEADDDGDGFPLCKGDCDDTDETAFPGAGELCDGADQDCDGLADATLGTEDGWVLSVCGVVVKGGGTLDAGGADQPVVLWNADLQVWQMWFRMVDSSSSATHRIGYAESYDGANWVKFPTPVIDVGASGAWDSVRLGFPTVVFAEGEYRMWFQGQDASYIKIGYASSPDGVSWTKYAGNPVLSVGASGTWDSRHVQAPSVIYDPSHSATAPYRIWYTGTDGTDLRIGYADSPDGVTWAKSSSWVLNTGVDGEWDSKRAVFGRVHAYNGLYHLWYSGDDDLNALTYEIGYASSSDGVTWSKDANNPIFSCGSGFSAYMIYAADVVQIGDDFTMFYSGGSSKTGPYSIGTAENLSPNQNGITDRTCPI